jgi:hypothetical protein
MLNPKTKDYIIGNDRYNVLSQLHVDQNWTNKRWYIVYPDGTGWDGKPYKTQAAAKAGLTRLKNECTRR